MRKKSLLLTSSLIALALLVFCDTPALATNMSQERCSAALETLAVLEPIKESFGLSDIDFEDMELGDQITAYDYVDGDLIENGFVIPFIVDGVVVATAQENSIGNLNVSVALAKAIEASCFEDVALIYDANGCYVTDGSELYLAGEAEEPDESKDILERDGLTEELASTIEVQDVTNGVDLAYETPASLAYVNGTLAYNQVGYVTQYPPSVLCGPASIACIVNYIQGIETHNACNVYYDCFGNWGYAIEMNTLQAHYALNGWYTGVNNYQYFNSGVTEAMCFSSLAQYKPIFGVWHRYNTNKNHAVVTFAIDTSEHCVAVMDPEFGPKLVYFDSYYGCYWYQSEYNPDAILYPIEVFLTQ